MVMAIAAAQNINESTQTVASLEGAKRGGRGGPPRVRPSTAVTPEQKFCVGKFTKIVDKRGRTGKKVLDDTLQG